MVAKKPNCDAAGTVRTVVQALELLWLARRHNSTLNSAKIKPVALVVFDTYMLDISKGLSQLTSQ